MRAALNVLLVEDTPSDVDLILRALRRSGYDPDYRCVDNAQSFNSALRERHWDVILCDYNLPTFNGLGALRLTRDTHKLDIPFLFVSGAIGEETAVDLMRAGAQDYVSKNNLTRLVAAIERELGAAETRHKKRQTEEKLAFEQQLLRQFMASTPDAISFKDLQRRYIQLNKAECRVLNIVREDGVLGKTADLLASPEADRTRAEEEKILTGNQSLANCIEKFATGGATRWYSTNRAPIRDQHGAIVGLVAVRHDITDQKLQAQMKDEFIATVSHELRTPLTSIAGALGLLESGAIRNLPGPATRLITIARSNCRRLTHLVNDILDIEKIETGKIIFNLRPVEIRTLVEQAIESNRGLAESYGVRVRFGSIADHAVIHGDSERLTQAITNVLSNAVKFSPRGSEAVVTIENHDTVVRISVRDHGPGIPESYKDRIFEKFVQVDATDARQKGGTGLGLSIVKEIVTRLDGKVYFEAARGNGTIFHIVLPRQELAKFDTDREAEAQRDGQARSRAIG